MSTQPVREFQLHCGGQERRVRMTRHPRARRYILRLQPDGVIRVTVPRGGTWQYARRFVHDHLDWLERQLRQPVPTASAAEPWRPGQQILFRGEEHPLTLVNRPGEGMLWIRFADQVVPLHVPREPAGQPALPGWEMGAAPESIPDLRPPVQAHLWQLARRELPPLTRRWAAQCGLTARRVTVRNQRTRWGSCSSRGSISLNWRLVMMPPWVRDYVILHELMHLRHPNHSPRFWRDVAAVCPACQDARAWLRRHGHRLH